jgi:hypothetical protein
MKISEVQDNEELNIKWNETTLEVVDNIVICVSPLQMIEDLSKR